MIRRVLVIVLAVAALGWAQGKRPFTFEDMMALKRVGEPVVSPDGKWVAFSAVEVNLKENKKTPHLWVVPLNPPFAGAKDGAPTASPEAKQITSDAAGEDRPRWSPDGKKLAFFTFPQSAAEPARMYEIAAEGGNPTELLPNDKHNQQDPNWSPDGTRIVFSGDQNDAAREAGKPTIRILDLATHIASFVPGSDGLFSPRWSADGKFLLGMKGDSRTLMEYSFETGKWRKVAEGNFGWVNYSHDGKYVYSLDFTGNGEVVRVDVADGKMERVADLKGFVTTGQYGGSLSMTPQDEPLLLRDRGTQDVYALDFTER